MSERDMTPRFNLWEEEWISVQRPGGEIERVSIRQALLQAHTIRTVVEPSPLVLVGIHRLLTAIVQDIYEPQSMADLRALYGMQRFDADRVDDFGQAFGDRFDLFSAEQPFYQSADLPREPARKDKTWAVSTMVPELPKGVEATHYRHGAEDDYVLCPACCAGGILQLTPFAASGGPGIKPSINGVPPVYVLPMGDTLMDSLVRSVVAPAYQPAARAEEDGDYWWRRDGLVHKKREIHNVGYGGSLTFTPRRMRLHPVATHRRCSRCGREMDWGVRTMVFEMGESRPKDWPLWLDPFVTYRMRKKGTPLALRPREGRALWRDYCELFMPGDSQQYHRPSVITQLAEAGAVRASRMSFRCIGMRTDMKAKIFEWVDDGFDVPMAVLSGRRGDRAIRTSLAYAEEAGRALSRSFRIAFLKRKDRHLEPVRERMTASYWQSLTVPFRELTARAAEVTDIETEEALCSAWEEDTSRTARRELDAALDTLSDDADTLRRRVKAQDLLARSLAKLRKG